MTYFVATTQPGAPFLLESGNLTSTLDPKEGLIGRRFLCVHSLSGEKVYLNIDMIAAITPAAVPAAAKVNTTKE